MALSASKNKQGRAYTSSLIAHLYALEQREANKPKRIRRQEITKLRDTINHIETKNYIKNQKQTNKKTENQKKTTKNKQTKNPEAFL